MKTIPKQSIFVFMGAKKQVDLTSVYVADSGISILEALWNITNIWDSQTLFSCVRKSIDIEVQ